MRLPVYPLLMLAALAASTSAALAQQTYHLAPGARVRLTAPTIPSDQRVVRILSTSSDTIVFRSERDTATRSLALHDIRSVEVSMGSRRRTARGAMIGLLAGAGLGGVLGYATYEPCEGFCFLEPVSAGHSALFGGMVGGTLGLVAGTTIGWFSKSEQWQSVPASTRVGILPSRSGPLLTISHRF